MARILPLLPLFALLAGPSVWAASVIAGPVQVAHAMEEAGKDPALTVGGIPSIAAAFGDDILVDLHGGGACQLRQSAGLFVLVQCFSPAAAPGQRRAVVHEQIDRFIAQLLQYASRDDGELLSPTWAMSQLLGSACDPALCTSDSIRVADLQRFDPVSGGVGRFGDVSIGNEGRTLVVGLGPSHALVFRDRISPALVLSYRLEEETRGLGVYAVISGPRAGAADVSEAQIEDLTAVLTMGLPQVGFQVIAPESTMRPSEPAAAAKNDRRLR